METKRCPICKKTKPLGEFHRYFSKPRNKYRPSNYCIPCGRESSRKRAIQHYQENKATKLQYARQYRANPENKEKLRALKLKFQRKYREELKDCYVRSLLAEGNKIPRQICDELPEIVETKRLQIKIKRKLNELSK